MPTGDRQKHDGPWSDGNVQFLRVWWLEGLSASQIAKKFAQAPLRVKVTRNAVISKLHRLGLTGRAPSKPGEKGPRKPHVAQHAKPTQKAYPNTTPKPYAPRGAAKSDANVPFISRASSQCANFVEGESGAEGFVCGAPVVGGKSWCACCVGLIYDGRTAREAIAA